MSRDDARGNERRRQRQNTPEGQGELLSVEQVADVGQLSRPVGRTEQAVASSLAAAQLDDVDAGAAALALECARACDRAGAMADPYGVAAAARELREALIRLRLDPVSRGEGKTDEFDAFLSNLGAS